MKKLFLFALLVALFSCNNSKPLNGDERKVKKEVVRCVKMTLVNQFIRERVIEDTKKMPELLGIFSYADFGMYLKDTTIMKIKHKTDEYYKTLSLDIESIKQVDKNTLTNNVICTALLTVNSKEKYEVQYLLEQPEKEIPLRIEIMQLNKQ